MQTQERLSQLNKADLKIRKGLADKNKSALQKYQELIVGKPGLLSLIKYELIITLISWFPGALGLLLRSKLYPLLLGQVGRNVVFGTNVVLRHPHKISIGDNVVIDDNCMLDAKGIQNVGITIGEGVFVGRNTILSCKDGDIYLKDGVNIGFNCEIFSSSSVVLGENALVAAYCYFVGGGNYSLDQPEISFAEQIALDSRGITVDRDTWIAANVTILDGVKIGQRAVVGAGALVREDVPPDVVAAGVPARVVKSREKSN